MSDCASKPEANPQLQRRIVVALQEGLPLARHPYRAVATELGIDEFELLEQLQLMKDSRAIRRIGAVPNHYALGYSHNLMVVWDIDDRHIARVGADIGALDFVSHCYRRPRREGWPYNLFAMVHGRSDAEVQEKIARIRRLVGSAHRDHTALKSTRILKKTGLRLRRQEN